MILKHIMHIGAIFLALILETELAMYIVNKFPHFWPFGLILAFLYGWFVLSGITKWFFRK